MKNGGTCGANDQCACVAPWIGVDCSFFDMQLTSGAPVPDQTVPSGTWRFYHIMLTSVSSIYFSVQQQDATEDCDLYVKQGSYPSRISYYARQNGIEQNFSLNITNATAGVWYAGVFGYSTCSYTIRATVAGSCLNSCSGHGTCNNGVCLCNSGFSGQDCSVTQTRLVQNVPASDSVTQNGWKYFTFQGATNMNSLVVTLTHNAGADADLFVAKDGNPSLYHWDYANLTTLSPSYVTITQVAPVIYYIGVYGYTAASFQVTATASSPTTPTDCPNQCSLHGSCSSGACVCTTGYSGRECETYLRLLTLGQSYTGLVGTNSWNYWHIQALSQNNLQIHVQQTNTNPQVADCDVYIRRGQNPTRFSYDYMDISLQTSFDISIPQPANDVWFIGFYGWKSCQYQVTVSEVATCSCPAGAHGRCLSGSSVCVCDDGWSGASCDQNLIPLNSGQVLTSSVGMNKWAYFSFSSNSSLFEVIVKETTTTGMLWTFTSQTHDYPTLGSYDDADQTPGVAIHYNYFEYPSIQYYTYTIGVYGTTFINSLSTTVAFQIVAWSPSP